MKRFVGLLSIILTLTAGGAAVDAQQAGNIPRVGILRTGSAPDPFVEAFRQGLRELGYVEGKSIALEYRWAEGKNERLAQLAADLVAFRVNVIVAAGPGPILAARQATSTIPIVMPVALNPVDSGLIASLARPGGNLTGLASQADELPGKWMELLKEVLPRASRIAVLLDQANDIGQGPSEAAARSFSVQLQVLKVKGPEDFATAFAGAQKNRAQALMILPSAFLYAHRNRLVELAAKHRLPAIYNQADWVAGSGGLMSYGPNLADMFRRAAIYVDKILKGAKPAGLPVEQPTKFELVIYLKAAKQINLTIPPQVLARATESFDEATKVPIVQTFKPFKCLRTQTPIRYASFTVPDVPIAANGRVSMITAA
jgi:putative ABC transport system substrate-binding protein